jgi:hypothetical protein
MVFGSLRASSRPAARPPSVRCPRGSVRAARPRCRCEIAAARTTKRLSAVPCKAVLHTSSSPRSRARRGRRTWRSTGPRALQRGRAARVLPAGAMRGLAFTPGCCRVEPCGGPGARVGGPVGRSEAFWYFAITALSPPTTSPAQTAWPRLARSIRRGSLRLAEMGHAASGARLA